MFRDEDELASAAELGPKLQGALAASGALIVVCSPASAGSQWVDKEIRTFKQINPGKPVFAVIAAGVPYATLYRRDRIRARKFAVAIGTFAVVLIAVLSALSIAAFTYAREAVKERNAAIVARHLAEKNADLAERKAWLAQTMATEYRRQSDELAGKGMICPPPR